MPWGPSFAQECSNALADRRQKAVMMDKNVLLFMALFFLFTE
jgi:hypothetical protein